MIDDLERVLAEGRDRIAAAEDLEAVRAVETELLGKRARLTELKQGLGGLEPDARRDAGRRLNEVRAELQEALAARRGAVEADARRARLEAERLDLTEVVTDDVLGHLHLVTQAHDQLEDVFVGMGFTVAEGPEIETEWYNFGALNFPPGHPARAMYDTLYVEFGEPESTLLRTHTSPVQMRVLEANEPPIYVVCPGRVYRSDTPDASHMPVFHQIEGLVVDRGISMGDLAGTLEAFTTAYFGGAIHSRLRPSYFPFTEPSAEYDITCVICEGEGCQTCKRTGWIELGGCGMVHPNVLRNGGVDPEEYTGFAFGFGTDRLSLMRYGISDLRDMFSNDIRFLRQF
ncbi:phenylalanine--tRNA ligase subunit alpha [Actinomarinicola tropica]|uniref:Phenylalanine--tRNA ligase alpha subunit n=1 Tax=Actinomarinicola tropica TaxID=2789776 RepID=A0A5Q2RKU7_9ACTN|nr:phenylalanine--tRNA ligase subunit alpha [Actinomarinicola tropica]QGG95201.1 phenylalanine--tRNA ligase subunit alpha [Actinomarinicola tropica]